MSEQQQGLVHMWIFTRRHNKGTQQMAGVAKVNHSYHSRSYRGNIRGSMKLGHVVRNSELAGKLSGQR